MASTREQVIKRRKARAFRRKVAAIAIIILIIAGAVLVYQFGGKTSPSEPAKVVLVTSMGNITIQLYDDMPITTRNFKNLTKLGIYDNTIFHRVVHDFVVQGGDPTGTGQGDPSIATIPDEYSRNAEHNRNDKYTMAMAKTSQLNSATSQFFINLKYNSDLDNNYSVFGKVVAGMNVVDDIGEVATDSNDRPMQEVKLTKAMLIGG